MEFPKELIHELKSAKSVLFFTGAGISAESGIETFRGKGGLWNKMKPEELAKYKITANLVEKKPINMVQ